MATCSSYEWSGWYPCSIEIDKLSRWRDFIRKTWIFGVQKGKEKKRSLSCNHVLTHMRFELPTAARHPWLWFSLQKCTREEILQTQQKSIGIKGSYLFRSIILGILCYFTGWYLSFIYLHHQFVAHWMCSHWPTTHAALNKFDPEPFHTSLGMEQLETSHRDLSIPHERLWTPQQRENTFRILEGHNLKMNWPQEHITRQETWV